MPIPNADRATIAVEKLTAYLLNPAHKRGAAKARLLVGLGYRTDAPEVLESDLRTQHLSLNATRESRNPYGVTTRSKARLRHRAEEPCASVQSGKSILEAKSLD